MFGKSFFLHIFLDPREMREFRILKLLQLRLKIPKEERAGHAGTGTHPSAGTQA